MVLDALGLCSVHKMNFNNRPLKMPGSTAHQN